MSLPASAWAQHFDWNVDARNAYGLILDLRFQKADSVLSSLAKKDADNLCVPYLRDLSDFLYIVVTEDEKEYERRSKHKGKREDAFEKAADNDPFKNLALGEFELHWAFADMRFGNYLSGAMGIRRAFGMLEENMQRFPYFVHTNKGLGLLHTLVGTVPDNYRWAARIMGMDGTIAQGMGEMGRIINGNSGKLEFVHVQKETLFLFTFLQINLMNEDGALVELEQKLHQHNGPLMDFAKARVMQRRGQTDAAIMLLEKSLAKRPSAFPYLHFLLGDMKLSRLDKDADRPFLNYLHIFKGKGYVKDAHRKLAWHALLVKGDENQYRKHLNTVTSTGSTMVDEDKSAQREAESGQIPNTVLLRTRVLFDGGYLDRALQELETASKEQFRTEDERLEREYRLGRIHHGLGNQSKAIASYRATMRDGAECPRYFAANAALQLGLLYEQMGEREKAREAFIACSSFKNSEYRDSINQKAKAGLLRL